MILPWPILPVLVAPAVFGLVYGVAVRITGRTVPTRLFVFEIAALLFLIFGWVYLAAVAGSD